MKSRNLTSLKTPKELTIYCRSILTLGVEGRINKRKLCLAAFSSHGPLYFYVYYGKIINKKGEMR